MADKNVQKKADAWSKRNLSAFEGLLNVNQFLPVTGDIQSGILAAQDVRNKDYGSAALNSLGLLPFIPALGGVIAKNIPSKTQFEVAHEIAQKNAALPVSEGGLGLPKNNTALDRAKAMGFDVSNPVYHGTNADITAFNPSLSDTARKTGTPTGAFVVTSNPATANTYGMDFVGDFTTTYKPNANVLPLYIRKGKNLSMNATQEGYTPNWNDIYNPKYPNIETTNEFAELAKSKGKESATIKNVKDNARISSAEGDTTFLFNPNQLRSVNAAFDPFRRNEADILAGLLAVPATQLMKPEEKKKKRNTK